MSRPARRFGGQGGANEIASLCWRTVLMTRQQGRKFVEKLDFISSAGFLDGSPGARERAGLPPNTGPRRVVTEMAVFDLDDEARRMRLRAVAPWTTVDDVVSEMGFKPLIAPSIETMDLTSEEELAALRADIDPSGRTVQGRWITVEEEQGRFRLVGQEAGTSKP